MVVQTGAKLLISSVVAWDNFINSIAALSDHSPTFGIDSYPYKLSDYARLIAVLGEFRAGKEKNPIITIQNENDLLSHLSFGFLFSGTVDLIFTTMEKTDLNIVSTSVEGGRVAIVTGTLGEWRNAIIAILSSEVTLETRQIFSFCYDSFHRLGLQEIWHDYSRNTKSKGTYLLEYKT